MAKLAILGGGGALGAFVVGYITTTKKMYDVYCATSTGTLIAILAAQGKFDKLVDLYLSIDNKEFGIDKINKGGIHRILSILTWRTLRGKKGLSDMGDKLEEKIRENYTKKEHQTLIDKGVKIYVTAQCISHFPEDVTYFANYETEYEEFVKACVASASVPVYAEPVKIGEHKYYCDGGIAEPIPTGKVGVYLNHEIDVLLNYPRELPKEINLAKNIFMVVLTTFELLHYNITKDDLVGLKNREYFMLRPPYKLAKNSINFNKEKMSNWYKMGVQIAELSLNK